MDILEAQVPQPHRVSMRQKKDCWDLIALLETLDYRIIVILQVHVFFIPHLRPLQFKADSYFHT